LRLNKQQFTDNKILKIKNKKIKIDLDVLKRDAK
jgi:hypothetical protein